MRESPTLVPGNPPPQNSAASTRSPAARRSASAVRSSSRGGYLPEMASFAAIRRIRAAAHAARTAPAWRGTWRKNLERGVARVAMWLPAKARQTAFRHGEAQRVEREGTTAASATARCMLDQRAFRARKRADPVVGGFEHVVGAADRSKYPSASRSRDVAGAVGGASDRHHRAVLALVALHQPQWRRVERQRNLRPRPVRRRRCVEQAHPIARRRLCPSRRASLSSDRENWRPATSSRSGRIRRGSSAPRRSAPAR